MKTVNSYDDNGFFNGVIPCQESPLEPGIYLIPAKSTELSLPTLSATEEAKFVNGEWTVVMSRAEVSRLLSLRNEDGVLINKLVDGVVVAKTEEELYQGIVDLFNINTFQTDLFSLLPSLSNPNLRLEFAALNTFARNKDFAGMQQYLGFLLSNEIATQTDVDAVLGCVTKQGIVVP